LDSIQGLTARLDKLSKKLPSQKLLQALRSQKDTESLLQSSIPEIQAFIESVSSDFQKKLRNMTEKLEKKQSVLGKCADNLQYLKYKLSEKMPEDNQQLEHVQAALRVEQGERSRLQAELEAAKQALAGKDDKEKERESKLFQALADLKTAQQREIRTRKEAETGLTSIEQAFKTKITSERDRLQALISTQSERLTPLLSLLEEWKGGFSQLQQELIDKDEEILRLRNLSEVQIPEEPVFVEGDSPLQDENERLRDNLSDALRRVEELEAANRGLQSAVRAQPHLPSTFELADTIDEVSSRCEENLHMAEQKLSDLDTKTKRVVAAVALLRNMNTGGRAAIRRAFQTYEQFTEGKMMEMGESLDGLEDVLMRRAVRPESEVYSFAMSIVDQLEDMILSRLDDTDARIDRLARTTENVINRQVEEIEQLRRDGRGLDSLGEDLEPLEMRGSAAHSIEEVLEAGGEAIVCKRTRFLDDVWCLTMVGEERDMYWWREEEYKQFDSRSEEWPEIEEDALKQQIETLTVQTKQLNDALKKKAAAFEEVQAMKQMLEKEGFDLAQDSLLSVLQELLEIRSQSQRSRLQLTAPIDAASLEHEDITVLTDDSGRHPASVPVLSNDEEMARLVQTLQRLTLENEDLGKTIEDLTRQNNLHKQALSRAQSGPGGSHDRLASTVVNLLEMMPEQPSNIESVIHVLYDLMLLSKDQVEEVQHRRTALSDKEEKKKTSWLHRKKK
jgi:hypothetical protein